jgi:hypothetical protein
MVLYCTALTPAGGDAAPITAVALNTEWNLYAMCPIRTARHGTAPLVFVVMSRLGCIELDLNNHP